jgi:LacI family transcriptional regulator
VADRERRSVTIYEVAARAGVSIATVSRALRDSPLVAAPTRLRVRRVAEELRFRPSRLARGLAEGQHAANGIVFPDLSGPYYAEVLLGYEAVVADLGRSVLILTTHGRRHAAEAVLELAGRVDGLVVMGRTVDDEVVTRVAEAGQPVVLVARPPVDRCDTVSADNGRDARALAGHLLGHGYRRLAYLGDPAESPDVLARYAGFAAALAAAGVTPPAGPVRCGFDVDAGHRAARRLLARRDRPRALVCANDEVALGALTAADELGLAVPGELAVTGWDDVMAARYARLTTVRQPMRELGMTAARWLHDRISGGTAAVRREVLPTELVVRSSCGNHDPESEVQG